MKISYGYIPVHGIGGIMVGTRTNGYRNHRQSVIRRTTCSGCGRTWEYRDGRWDSDRSVYEHSMKNPVSADRKMCVKCACFGSGSTTDTEYRYASSKQEVQDRVIGMMLCKDSKDEEALKPILGYARKYVWNALHEYCKEEMEEAISDSIEDFDDYSDWLIEESGGYEDDEYPF